MTTNTTVPSDFPPLPEPQKFMPPHNRNFIGFVEAYSASQMHAYVLADRQLRAPVETAPALSEATGSYSGESAK